MAFFLNKMVNRLNLHVALINLLDQSFIIFGPIYLYTKGISVIAILFIVAVLNLLRIPFRLLSFPVMRRWGLRTGILLGATGYGLSFPVLILIQGIDGWLVLYVLMFAIFQSMHWFCFHIFYSLAGEQEHRGRHVAASQALTTLLAALSPLISSIFIVREGFHAYFLLASGLILLMWIAMARCEKGIIKPADWRESLHHIKSLGTQIQFLESASFYPITIGWLFTLYFYFGKITTVGRLVAFGVFVQMLYQLLLGMWVDRGHGRLILNTAEIIRSLVVAARAFMPLSLSYVLALESFAAIGTTHHAAVAGPALYNAGKSATQIILYWLFAETMWDIGTLVGTGSSAVLMAAGIPLRHALLIALPFMWILWRVLSHYYRNHAYVTLAS